MNKKLSATLESSPASAGDLACLRCGYTWEPRAYRLRDHLPRACPQCKSRAWNEQRDGDKEVVSAQ